MGFVGPPRERERGDSARDSLTRLLELASSWQQVQQHRQAIPQTLRALQRGEAFSGAAGRARKAGPLGGLGPMATGLEQSDRKTNQRGQGRGLLGDREHREPTP